MHSIGSGLFDLSLLRLNLYGASTSDDMLVIFVSLEDRSWFEPRFLTAVQLLGRSFFLEFEFDLIISFFRVALAGLAWIVLRLGSDGNLFLPFKLQFSVNADRVEFTLVKVVTIVVSWFVLLGDFLAVFKGLLP